MRKIPVILLLAFFAMPAIYGQIKIGDNPQAISPTSVLELESNDRVLVITRINTAQMDAIVPDQGAMVYNTDTQCIHYYDGAQWVNLCSGGFEIPENSISTEHIINGGINGVDIQNGSIGPGKLQDQSVTQEKLGENSVGAFALDNDNINLSDFTNDQGFITIADVISAAAGNDIIDNGGAFYDDQTLQDDIVANTTAINAIGTPNLNEVLQQGNIAGGLQIKGLAAPADPADAATKEYVDDEIANAAGSDNQNLTGATLNASNVLQIDIEDGNSATVNLSSLAGGGGSQNLTNVLTQGNDAGGTRIIGLGTPTLDQDAATKLYVDNAVTAGGSLTLDNILVGDAANAPQEVPIANIPLSDWAAATDSISMGDFRIFNLEDPIDVQDAATKSYVDNAVTAGGSLTLDNILVGDAANAPQEVPIANIPLSDWAAATDSISMGNFRIFDLEDPVDDQDAATKKYVDDNVGSSITDDKTITGAGVIGDSLRIIPSATNGQFLRTDPTSREVVWDDAPGEHKGAPKSVFFAATDSTATTTETNTNPDDDGGLVWDTDARQLGSFSYGALHVGLQAGSPDVSNNSKMVIIERIANSHTQQGLAFPLQIQNENGTDTGNAATGVLFAVDAGGGHGKGGVVLERKGAWGIGDFHFLLSQDSVGSSLPTIADKAFTVTRGKDIVLYGGIDIDGTGSGTGFGGTDQVLTADGSGGILWKSFSGAGEVNRGNNAGTGGGVGPYIQTDTTYLQFKNFRPNSNKITITDNPSNREILVDIDTTNVSLPATQIVYDPSASSLPASVVNVQAAIDSLAATSGGQNLSNTNLAQTDALRTYEVGTGEALVFTGPGNIGFGNGANPPLSKLHFASEIRVQGVNSSDGTVGSPAYSFSGDAMNDTGLYRPAADEIGFATGGIEAFRIDEYTTGNTQVLVSERIGVGFSLPADAPYAGADVHSSLQVNGSFATGIRSSGSNTSLDDNDYTLILTTGALQVGLPTPNGIAGRIYIVKNTSLVDANFTGNDYVPSNSSGNTTLISASSVIQIQSDGANWQQIN